VAAAAATGLVGLAAGSGVGVAAASAAKTPTTTTQPKERHTYPHVTVTSTMGDVLDNPAFAGFSQYMVPTEDVSRLATFEVFHSIPALSSWDPQTMVDGINFMIDQVNAGQTIFYPLYSAKEIAADPSKNSAGLFFIPGDPGKPLAVVAAGGGFRAVTSIQEAFPHAQKLHELGYNVAIVKYRVGTSLGQGQTTQTTPAGQTTQAQGQSAQNQKNVAVARATEDMAAAMKMLRNKAHAWHISLHDYSAWGSSAGGELMTAWASSGPNGAKAHGFQPPTVVVGAYTSPEQIEVAASFPPYFATDAADDHTVPVAGVEKVINQLKAKGVTVKYELYPSAGHGFGIGTGTPAAGWLDHAVAFWKAHMKG
jgi:acetyl esterase/lipase